MSTPCYAVIGAAGCGRGLMPLLREQVAIAGFDPESAVFVDDDPGLRGHTVNGNRVVSMAEFTQLKEIERHAVVGIANSAVRERLVVELQGVSWLTLRHGSVVLMDNVSVGEGACLSPHVVLTSNIQIGRHFHANLFSYVEHDCVIGDFVTFGPRVSCNGNIVIEDHAYIGTGAVLRQGKPGKPLRIGRGAVVGMGAVVTKDVAPGATVVGNPARPLVRS